MGTFLFARLLLASSKFAGGAVGEVLDCVRIVTIVRDIDAGVAIMVASDGCEHAAKDGDPSAVGEDERSAVISVRDFQIHVQLDGTGHHFGNHVDQVRGTTAEELEVLFLDSEVGQRIGRQNAVIPGHIASAHDDLFHDETSWHIAIKIKDDANHPLCSLE